MDWVCAFPSPLVLYLRNPMSYDDKTLYFTKKKKKKIRDLFSKQNCDKREIGQKLAK